mgnify:CR=1 FL=1
MYDWFTYIDLYCKTTNEKWSDVYSTNIHQFFSVLTYANTKLKKEREAYEKFRLQHRI